MKKYSLVVIAFLLFIACDDIPNSELFGKWQLKTVENFGHTSSVDTVWYNFQSESVFSVQVYNPQQDTVFVLLGFRTQSDDMISVILDSESYMDMTDWESRNRSFKIDMIDKKTLILFCEKGQRYTFKRF